MGKTIKGNQMLEDDQGAINECVVEDARIIYSIITIFEQEKLYLNTDVKIGDIARRLGTNKTYLSRLKSSQKNWLGMDVEAVLTGITDYLKSLS